MRAAVAPASGPGQRALETLDSVALGAGVLVKVAGSTINHEDARAASSTSQIATGTVVARTAVRIV